MTKISEKEIEAAMSAWGRALADAPDESVYERRRRCIHAALSAASRVREEDNAREPTMSVEELVKQLRSRAYEIYGQTRYSNYLDKAADKLEELLKKQEELSSEVERVRDGNRYAHLERIAIKRAEKAEAALVELEVENERLKKALERVPDEAGHWAYVHCRVHIGSEHEDELSEFVTQKVRSFAESALAQDRETEMAICSGGGDVS